MRLSSEGVYRIIDVTRRCIMAGRRQAAELAMTSEEIAQLTSARTERRASTSGAASDRVNDSIILNRIVARCVDTAGMTASVLVFRRSSV
jgi:hypothetical protein